MKIILRLVLILNVFAIGMRRGPHHPQGQESHSKHNHYIPRDSETLTKDSQLLHDIEHLEEDTKWFPLKELAFVAPEELEFFYFTAHDFDKNSKLDGLELLKAVLHTVEGHDSEADNSIEPRANDLELFVALVDRTLQSDDIDNDGFISYAEYRAARKKNPTDYMTSVVMTNLPPK